MNKRLPKEFEVIQKKPPSGVEIILEGSDITKWIATIHGPSGTPYEGGKFKVSVKFSSEYPHKAPNLVCTTPIYHPNVDSETKNFCLEILSSWGATTKMSDVFVAVIELLKHPHGESPNDAECGHVWKTDPKRFEQTAREWTQKHAK
jgi:ubiquitin-conjugating enzyme E2 D/E